MTAKTLSEWLRWIETLHPRSIDLGLERVHVVLDVMGRRRPPFAVITVAGTNGKGSTVTMCEAILRAAGFRIGTYTSPHLLRYNERVRVDGRFVSDAQLCAAFERIEAHRNDVSLTYFEYGTIAAFDIFFDEKIDIAVLEVGMGGRLDAVNAVDADVSVVTSIGIDHTNWLGPDRESIAREKAGVYRRGRPAICGDLDPPKSLLEVATAIGAELYLYGREFKAVPEQTGWSFQSPRGTRPGLPAPALRGDYQLRNAACALMALETLSDRFPLTQAHIREGLLSAILPGRFQVLPGMPSTILDVAHNAAAAEVLAQNLRQHRVPGRTYAVFGMLIDKAIADVAHALTNLLDGWYVASLPGPRGATAAQIDEALRQAGVQAPIACFEQVVAAYQAARAAAKPPDRIVVFGSFYTVGDILAHLNAGPA